MGNGGWRVSTWTLETRWGHYFIDTRVDGGAMLAFVDKRNQPTVLGTYRHIGEAMVAGAEHERVLSSLEKGAA